jgi:hypothetical protein
MEYFLIVYVDSNGVTQQRLIEAANKEDAGRRAKDELGAETISHNRVVVAGELEGPNALNIQKVPAAGSMYESKDDRKAEQYLAGAIEEEDPFAGILRGLEAAGVGTDRGTIGGRFNRNFMENILNTFRFADVLSGAAGTEQIGIEGLLDPDTVGRLEDYTQRQGGSRSRIRSQAGDLLQQLSGSRTFAVEGAGGDRARQLQGIFNQPNLGQAGALGSLAHTALSGRISPLSMGLLNLPSGAQVRTDYLAAGGGEGDFLDDLLRSYYLS